MNYVKDNLNITELTVDMTRNKKRWRKTIRAAEVSLGLVLISINGNSPQSDSNSRNIVAKCETN
jgi:hypothetical protein